MTNKKSANSNLHSAKKNKKDEFYTQINDIELELKYYKEHFKDKIIFLNCDDPTKSHFWKYFAMYFDELGVKKVIATHYHPTEPTYKLEMNKRGEAIKTPLKTNGDFRSPECIEILKEADIVVTNPPFSLFREYVAQLMEYDKKFLIIGSQNALTYKEIFPLIKDNEIWLGIKSGDMSFRVPDDSEPRKTRYWVDEKGQKWRSMGNVCWFTNLDHYKRHTELIRDLVMKYSPEKYPKYDNYDAINVDKVADIPVDYFGVMGVPITFIDKYNPDEFEIVSFRKTADGKELAFTSEMERQALLENPSNTDIEDLFPKSTSIAGVIKNSEGVIDGKAKYARVLIKRKSEKENED